MNRQLLFPEIRNLIQHKQLFSFTPYVVNNSFTAYDSEEFFKYNLKHQPKDWYYRNNPVKISLNSNGYRTKEFTEIDWKNSIFIFGCSNTFGEGLDDSNTISKNIENITGIPTINLGVSGSSMMFNFHNSILLKNICAKPLAVIQNWSGFDRIVEYSDKEIKHHGAWSLTKDNLMGQWSNNTINSLTNGIMIQQASRHLWEDTKFYDFTYFPDTAQSLPCDLLNALDVARDLKHAGLETAKHAAEKIIEKLNL